MLGLASVDAVNKTVQLRFTDLQLDRCEGAQPVPDGKVELRWHKESEKLRYTVAVPAGYSVRVDNRSKLALEEGYALPHSNRGEGLSGGLSGVVGTGAKH